MFLTLGREQVVISTENVETIVPNKNTLGTLDSCHKEMASPPGSLFPFLEHKSSKSHLCQKFFPVKGKLWFHLDFLNAS